MDGTDAQYMKSKVIYLDDKYTKSLLIILPLSGMDVQYVKYLGKNHTIRPQMC